MPSSALIDASPTTTSPIRGGVAPGRLPAIPIDTSAIVRERLDNASVDATAALTLPTPETTTGRSRDLNGSASRSVDATISRSESDMPSPILAGGANPIEDVRLDHRRLRAGSQVLPLEPNVG